MADLSATASLIAASSLTSAATITEPGAAALVAASSLSVDALVTAGTLVNPYHMAETDSCAVDFTGALYVSSDPPALSGPVDAPSIWYEFTESQSANWVASTSGFAHGADIEFYTGPPGAGPDDLTFIGTDGNAPTDLGAVTISGLATLVVTPVRIELLDLGVVALDASVVAAVLV